MTGVALSLEARELRTIGRRLEVLLRHMGDLTPLMRSVGGILEASTIDRFEKGVAPDGSDWEPSQRAVEENGQTLVNRGRLMGSINAQASSDQVEIGTNLVYGAIHQLGGYAGRGHAAFIPARPYLGVSAGDEREIRHESHEYVLAALGIRGGRR